MSPTARLVSLSLAILSAFGCSYVPSSPLGQATVKGDLPEVRRLLAASADPDAPVSGFDITPLGISVRIGRPDIAAALLDAGADSEMLSGVNDWTPLVHAVHRGQEETVRLLLSRTHPGKDSLSKALTMAAGYGMTGIVRELVAAEAPGTPEALVGAVGGTRDIDAAWNGCGPHTEAVRALLQASPDLRLPDSYAGRAALRFAEKKGCTEVLALVRGQMRDQVHAAR